MRIMYIMLNRIYGDSGISPRNSYRCPIDRAVIRIQLSESSRAGFKRHVYTAWPSPSWRQHRSRYRCGRPGRFVDNAAPLAIRGPTDVALAVWRVTRILTSGALPDGHGWRGWLISRFRGRRSRCYRLVTGEAVLPDWHSYVAQVIIPILSGTGTRYVE